MDKVTIKRDGLLAALRENREAHQGIFDEAVEGYKAKAEKQLKAHLKRVREGHMEQVAVYLEVPVNHTKDYDRIIKMVELNVGEDITLSQRDFASYVMDDWSWKQQFLSSNAGYSATATALLDKGDF